jgi:putative hemin transport protein
MKNIVRKDGWFNLLEKRFNLHLLESRVKSTWIVRKPTVDGIVTSVELVGDAGEEVVQLFGKRKPGTPELSAWRGLVEEFAAKTAAV